MSPFEATAYELKALEAFASQDTTRPHLATVWMYSGDEARTYVATDGHTITIRRSGLHASMQLVNIARGVECIPLRKGTPASTTPPAWDQVLHEPPIVDKAAPRLRGINPLYVGRVALVEKAAGRRDAEDFKPFGYEARSAKAIAKARADRRSEALSVWTIGSDVLDAWYWRINAHTALWEGAIMPRRP